MSKNSSNTICMPESFNRNVFIYYKITFVISQHENTNLNGDFVLKNMVETFVLNFLVYKNKSDSDLV